MMPARKIFKNATTAQFSIRDVIAMVFAQELLAPSRELFIVAPWISNIVVFDNRNSEFDALSMSWGRRDVRLIDVLKQLAGVGTQIRIYVRPDSHNETFATLLEDAMTDAGLNQYCALTRHAHLHTKSLLSDSVMIEGSMNLTERGIALNDEQVSIVFDRQQIASARVHFSTYEQR